MTKLYEQIYTTVGKNRVATNTATQIAMRIKGNNLMGVIAALGKMQKANMLELVTLGGKQCYKARPGITDFDHGK